MAKVVLIGCGNVGMSYAYAMVACKSNVNELVLIDINSDKACGEAQDLSHASVYNSTRTKVRAGNYADCDDADLICITAGAVQKPGQSRRELINCNFQIMKNIVDQVSKTKFDGVYLIATNPVDVMTYAVWKLSGAPHTKVVGSGTTLDTARLRHLIGQEIGIHPKDIHGYVIGEHGDSAMIPWSCSIIGLNEIDRVLSEEKQSRILDEVRASAYDIIAKKGSTYFGIGICLMDITEAILSDSGRVKTVSVYCEKEDIYFGMPSILCKKGVSRTCWFKLAEKEQVQLDDSIKAIRSTIDQISW